jgi:hypothetical protein
MPAHWQYRTLQVAGQTAWPSTAEADAGPADRARRRAELADMTEQRRRGRSAGEKSPTLPAARPAPGPSGGSDLGNPDPSGQQAGHGDGLGGQENVGGVLLIRVRLSWSPRAVPFGGRGGTAAGIAERVRLQRRIRPTSAAAGQSGRRVPWVLIFSRRFRCPAGVTSGVEVLSQVRRFWMTRSAIFRVAAQGSCCQGPASGLPWVAAVM